MRGQATQTRFRVPTITAMTNDKPADAATRRETSAPTVAIVGAGAIGTFFAAHLTAAGHDVTVCVRRRFDELVVDGTGGETLRATPRVVGAPDELPVAADGSTDVDWLLLATKAHQTAGAKGWLTALAGPATKVVVLQNGVEHAERVRPFLAHAATEIVPAVVYCGAELLGPGHIVHRTNGFLIVPAGPPADALAKLFVDAVAGIRPTADFTTAAWQKLCANVAANGITALTGCRVEVFERDDIVAVGRAIVAETIAVARAEGAAIDDSYADLLFAGIAATPGGGGTSMLYDRLAGRPLEHDALYGAVTRAGRRHAIPTPLHDTFSALLAAIPSDGPPDPTLGSTA